MCLCSSGVNLWDEDDDADADEDEEDEQQIVNDGEQEEHHSPATSPLRAMQSS